MKITASAPGKVILIGEHSVVYGEPAIAAAIDRRTTVVLETCEKSLISLKSLIKSDSISEIPILYKETWTFDPVFPTEDKSLRSAAKTACNAIVFGLNKLEISKDLKFSITVESDIPIGAGLGSSAAFCVALAEVLLRISGNYKLKIDELANSLEAFFHENPSGVDTMVCKHGGLVAFAKGIRNELITENLKVNEIIRNNFKITIVNTNIARSTKAMVKKVRLNFEKNVEFVRSTCQAITALVNQYKQSLEIGSVDELEGVMEKCHHLLNSLGVGHNSIDFAHSLAKNKYNKILKTTGAGGGGCI